jgi:hypothetical protein
MKREIKRIREEINDGKRGTKKEKESKLINIEETKINNKETRKRTRERSTTMMKEMKKEECREGQKEVKI